MNHDLITQIKLTLIALSLISGLAVETPAVTGQIDSLQNGMKMILVENHASPMIASVIFVKSGSKYESEYENGITHFLEHLLFDGTANLSREELDASISDLGGYINAFTRKDLTAFMVLLPSQYIEHGLTVQADMLFNSIFPEDELAKERKVVIEEIRQSADAPGAPVDDFFTEKAYGNTIYGRPVLGFESFIANIPRAMIIDYWKTNYAPDKMTALVIGNFDTEAMRQMMNDIFGSIQSPDRTDTLSPTDLHQQLAEAKGHTDQIVGEHIYDTVAEVRSAYVNFSIAGPDFKTADYLSFDLLAQYLALDEISPLKIALQGGAEPLATEVSVALATRPEFTRLEISVVTEQPEKCDSIVQTTLSILGAISSHQADSTDLLGIKTTTRCEAIYYSEKLHFYAFIISPMMMTGGWEWIQTYPELLDSVDWKQCQTAAQTWLTTPNYVATIVRPADSTQIPYKATCPTEESIIAHFDSTVFEEYDLTAGAKLVYPTLDSVSMEITDPSIYHREVLDNGLTVIVKSSQDSKVFAVNLLGRNRTANEPDNLTGITDFVNRCFEKGTASRDAARLSRELASIGANLTLVDNPWIPFDDRYTKRQFSFVKFETIEPYASEGFELLTDLVNHPTFDSAEVENVRNEMLGILGRNAGSTSQAARNLFFETIFSNHDFARPIMGTPRTISTIGVDDLRAYHACFYSPQNLIMSIVTNRDTSEVMGWVRNLWSGFTNKCDLVASPVAPEPATASGPVHYPIAKEQIAIRVGSRLPGANSDETLELQVAASILSHRLFDNLREKQGLAYSTGAGTGFDRNFGWYFLSIGTGSSNYARALDGLTLQTEKLAFDGPTPTEVTRAKNQIWGRLMSAKLSRINQAYYMGLNEFYGRAVTWDKQLMARLNQVNAASVRRVAAQYFRPETWIEVTAGTRP
ncbi:MAG: insulinase family protein [candidate division Zixibacteria bacterium]|nr:insulinase family protein [candidate division Zixibacteria bacterium]